MKHQPLRQTRHNQPQAHNLLAFPLRSNNFESRWFRHRYLQRFTDWRVPPGSGLGSSPLDGPAQMHRPHPGPTTLASPAQAGVQLFSLGLGEVALLRFDFASVSTLQAR